MRIENSPVHRMPANIALQHTVLPRDGTPEPDADDRAVAAARRQPPTHIVNAAAGRKINILA